MARLYTSGFELNSLTAGVEFITVAATGASIATLAKRSGTYGLRISSLSSATVAGVLTKWVGSSGSGPFFLRTYLNVQTVPSASNTIITLNAASGAVGSTPRGQITLENNGTLILRNSAGTQIGSASSAVNDGTWHMVELKHDSSAASGSRVTEARLDGSVFATSSTQTDAGMLAFSLGGNLASEAQTTGEWWFDDVALNDSTGGSQTGYPGSGTVLITRPSGAGDSAAWTIAGSSPAATNWQSVNETPPNDATTLVNEALLNDVDLYAVSSLGLHSYDTITLVQVGGRFNNDTADITSAFQFELEKTTGGTKQQSSSIIPNSTTFRTNSSTAGVIAYPLTAYTDPDSAAWTNTTLDSMQIGMISGTVGVRKVQVTAIWAYVEYVPGVAPVSNTGSTLMSMGVG